MFARIPFTTSVAWVLSVCSTVLVPSLSYAATFTCSDVPCLVDAVQQANTNGEDNLLLLAAGTYVLTGSTEDGAAAGLLVLRGTLTVRGAGPEATVLQRAADAPLLRLAAIAPTGVIRLQQLAIEGGRGLLNEGTLALRTVRIAENGGPIQGGGGLTNRGLVTIAQSVFEHNGVSAGVDGGGLLNTNHGTMVITDTLILRNVAGQGGGLAIQSGHVTLIRVTITRNFGQGSGGGVGNGFPFFDTDPGGTLIIRDSSFIDNETEGGVGIGIANHGHLEVTNTTFSGGRNSGAPGSAQGRALYNAGTAMLINTTITGHVGNTGGLPPSPAVAALYATPESTTVLVNTILSGNTVDCFGPLTSWDHNLIGQPDACFPEGLNPQDLVGQPGLGPLSDTGRPGGLFYPLTFESLARNEGGQWLCPQKDQLGRPRRYPCDIGAIEFRARDTHPTKEMAEID